MTTMDAAWWGASLIFDPSPITLRLAWSVWASEPTSVPMTLADLESFVAAMDCDDE